MISILGCLGRITVKQEVTAKLGYFLFDHEEDVRSMQSWRGRILALGATMGSFLFVRDMWIAPNRAALDWDVKFLASVALVALLTWLARRSPYAKLAIFLAGGVVSLLIGFHEWKGGKQFELFLCVLIFLSLLGGAAYGIKQIADHGTKRQAGGPDLVDGSKPR